MTNRFLLHFNEKWWITLWKKIIGAEQTNFTDFLMIISGLLIIIGGITGRPILFVISFLYLLYFLLNLWYEKSIGSHFNLQNNKKTIRLFPGDEAHIELHFENRSIFPFIHGVFRFLLDDVVIVLKRSSATPFGHDEFPLSIPGKGMTTLSIPIRGEKRGVAKLSQIQYRYPHLFKFHNVHLEYEHFFQQEVIVYPEPLPVEGLHAFFRVAPGLEQTRISPFVNMEQGIGTRNYHSGDPFKHINWNATAKQQTLQTNTFEKTIDKSLIMIINLQQEDRSNHAVAKQQLEKFLSHATYLAQYATKAGYPYQIFINSTQIGGRQSHQSHSENSQVNYMRTLEMLAHIPTHPMTFPISALMNRLDRSFTQPRTMIIIGEIFPQMNEMMTRNRINHAYFQVKATGEKAVLVPYNARGQKSYAN